MHFVAPEDPATADASYLLENLSKALARITGDSGNASFDPDDVRGANAQFVVARTSTGEPVGCGAFRPLHGQTAEIKRMYAAPGTRGVGAAVLLYLERSAAEMNYVEFWLETRAINTRAVDFYKKHGYSRIPNFGKYAGNEAAVCFAKAL
jgi:ribosomal protein S18 acetylase RimI-like enzyme